jgi:hypothetical protein
MTATGTCICGKCDLKKISDGQKPFVYCFECGLPFTKEIKSRMEAGLFSILHPNCNCWKKSKLGVGLIEK